MPRARVVHRLEPSDDLEDDLNGGIPSEVGATATREVETIPQARPVRRTSDVAGPPPTMGEEWEQVEASLRRLIDGAATVDDHAKLVSSGLSGKELDKERFRLNRVIDYQRRAGTWEKVDELRQRASDIRNRVDADRVAVQQSLEAKLAEAERIVAELRSKLRDLAQEEVDAAAAVVEVETANAELRKLAPRHVHQLHRSAVLASVVPLQQRLGPVRNRIGRYRSILETQENSQPTSDMWRDVRANIIRLELYDIEGWENFDAEIRDLGMRINVGAESKSFFRRVCTKISAELPALEREDSELEAQLNDAMAAADGVLDVYLPHD